MLHNYLVSTRNIMMWYGMVSEKFILFHLSKAGEAKNETNFKRIIIYILVYI